MCFKETSYGGNWETHFHFSDRKDRQKSDNLLFQILKDENPKGHKIRYREYLSENAIVWKNSIMNISWENKHIENVRFLFFENAFLKFSQKLRDFWLEILFWQK